MYALKTSQNLESALVLTSEWRQVQEIWLLLS